MEVVVTTGAISHTKFQSNRHHQRIIIQLLTGWMPFLLPNHQCPCTEGNLLVGEVSERALSPLLSKHVRNRKSTNENWKLPLQRCVCV